MRTDREEPIPDVVLGTSFFGRAETAFPVYDAYWAAGRRRFDTAWIYGYAYGPGCCESTFGAWLAARGVAEDAWVLAKGAHTPECRPDRVTVQLAESLDRMGLNRVACYMLHRDDTEVPVGEFVDVLSGLVKDGVVEAYGFSNWTLPRVREAVAYAEREGLPQPCGISNQFSLVEMVQPLFPGVEGANSAQWREWLPESGMTLFPWASQGRGCLALADPAALRTDPLADSWYSEANVGRIHRARQLAARKGTSPTAIGLAWVLAQPFAVCPIIGPRTRREVQDSLQGLEHRLTAGECQGLEGL